MSYLPARRLSITYTPVFWKATERNAWLYWLDLLRCANSHRPDEIDLISDEKLSVLLVSTRRFRLIGHRNEWMFPSLDKRRRIVVEGPKMVASGNVSAHIAQAPASEAASHGRALHGPRRNFENLADRARSLSSFHVRAQIVVRVWIPRAQKARSEMLQAGFPGNSGSRIHAPTAKRMVFPFCRWRIAEKFSGWSELHFEFPCKHAGRCLVVSMAENIFRPAVAHHRCMIFRTFRTSRVSPRPAESIRLRKPVEFLREKKLPDSLRTFNPESCSRICGNVLLTSRAASIERSGKRSA